MFLVENMFCVLKGSHQLYGFVAKAMRKGAQYLGRFDYFFYFPAQLDTYLLRREHRLLVRITISSWISLWRIVCFSVTVRIGNIRK